MTDKASPDAHLEKLMDDLIDGTWPICIDGGCTHPLCAETREKYDAARSRLREHLSERTLTERRVWVHCPNCKTGFINTISEPQ